jgi:hypothetical protein
VIGNKEKQNAFWNKYYGSLVGATIVKFQGIQTFDEPDFIDGFPVYLVKFTNGELREIAISRDPEMNGGGFIVGLPTGEK